MTSFNDLDPIKMVIVASKLYHTINDQLEGHIKNIEVNRSEFLVLHAIASKGPAAIQTIGEMIHISSSTMTYTVDKLEKRGLIRRVPGEADRRIILVEMTMEGELLWEKTSQAHLDHLLDMLKEVDEQDLKQMIQLMKRIGKSISEYKS